MLAPTDKNQVILMSVNAFDAHRIASIEFIRKYQLYGVFPEKFSKSPSDPTWRSKSDAELFSELAKIEVGESKRNIGAFMSEQISDIDVDSDNELFKEALLHFNPGCKHIFGTTKRPNTHYLNNITEPYSRQLGSMVAYIRKYALDGEHEALNVELLGTQIGRNDKSFSDRDSVALSNFTLMPGSITGSPDDPNYREWKYLNKVDGDLNKVDSFDLMKWIGFSAAATIIAHYWPTMEGDRHFFVRDIYGALCRFVKDDEISDGYRLTKEDVERFVNGFTSIAGDKWKRIGRDVTDTLRKLENPEIKVTGFTTASKRVMPDDVAEQRKLSKVLSVCFGRDLSSSEIEEEATNWLKVDEKYYIAGCYLDCDTIGAMRVGRSKMFMEGYIDKNANTVEITDKDGNTKHTRIGKFVLSSSALQEFYGFMYKPVAGIKREVNDLIVMKGAGKFVNTYVIPRHMPKEEIPKDVYEYNVDLFNRYMEALIPDEEQRITVTSFLAHMLQRPQEKPETALFLSGKKQGSGKSFISANIIPNLIGRSNVTTLDERQVTSKFNSDFSNKLVVGIEEVSAKAGKKFSDALKHMITSKVIGVEAKGKDRYEDESFHRYIATSNNTTGLILEGGEDERRIHLIECGSGINRNDNPELHEEVIRSTIRRNEFDKSSPEDIQEHNRRCNVFYASLYYHLFEYKTDFSVIKVAKLTDAKARATFSDDPTFEFIRNMVEADFWIPDATFNGRMMRKGYWQSMTTKNKEHNEHGDFTRRVGMIGHGGAKLCLPCEHNFPEYVAGETIMEVYEFICKEMKNTDAVRFKYSLVTQLEEYGLVIPFEGGVTKVRKELPKFLDDGTVNKACAVTIRRLADIDSWIHILNTKYKYKATPGKLIKDEADDRDEKF